MNVEEEDASVEVPVPSAQTEITTPEETRYELPKITCNSEENYFAVYYTEPRVTYYWGRVMRTFSKEEGEVSEVELNFLKEKTIGSNPKDWSWVERKTSDVSVVPVQYVFFGPVHPEITKSTFYFPDITVSGYLNKIHKACKL